MYVPSRVGLYVQLERAGWSNAELRLAAYLEEGSIEALVCEDFSYADDDLDTLIAHFKDYLTGLKYSMRQDAGGNVIDLTPERERAERELAVVTKWKEAGGIPEARRAAVAKRAYRIRARNEMIRLNIIEGDRAKLRAGYGPLVQFREFGWGPDAKYDPQHIDWDFTIRQAIAHAEQSAESPIRVDGFLLSGDKVVSTRTMTPREYEAAWEKQRIADYLHTWARLAGERRCLNCLAPLPDDAKDTRKFCNDRCRNAEKMRRHRRENPAAVERAQERYWRT